MTRAETAEMLAYIAIAYPNGKIEPNMATINLWAKFTEDVSYSDAVAAVDAYVATSPFPPAVADFRSSLTKIKTEARGDLSAGEAWAKVWKAMSLFSYHRGDEAREWLGDRLWGAVQLVGGWSYLCTTEDDVSTLSAQFERRYKAAQEQRNYRDQIPPCVRAAIAGMAEQITLPGGASALRIEARAAIDHPREDEGSASVKRPGTVILTPERLAELQAAVGQSGHAFARAIGQATELQPRDDKLNAVREQARALLAREATA